MSLPSCGLAADETVVGREPQPPPRSPKKPAASNTRDQPRDCPKRGQDSCIRLENKRCPQDLRSPVPFSDSLLSHLGGSWENCKSQGKGPLFRCMRPLLVAE